MSDTLQMIEIINQNKDKHYKLKNTITTTKKSKKAFVSDLITVGIEAILFLTFVDVISKIITK